jgi:hypothetical protein
MALEQHYIIKFLRAEGLELREIAKDVSSAYGPDGYIPSSIKS